MRKVLRRREASAGRPSDSKQDGKFVEGSGLGGKYFQGTMPLVRDKEPPSPSSATYSPSSGWDGHFHISRHHLLVIYNIINTEVI